MRLVKKELAVMEIKIDGVSYFSCTTPSLKRKGFLNTVLETEKFRTTNKVAREKAKSEFMIFARDNRFSKVKIFSFIETF